MKEKKNGKEMDTGDAHEKGRTARRNGSSKRKEDPKKQAKGSGKKAGQAGEKSAPSGNTFTLTQINHQFINAVYAELMLMSSTLFSIPKNRYSRKMHKEIDLFITQANRILKLSSMLLAHMEKYDRSNTLRKSKQK
jgi:hypothetical protein